MEIALLGLSIICGITSFVCWIWTVVTAFREGSGAEGILSICPLVGFILGWIHVGDWNHAKVMIPWSVCVVINIALQAAAGAMVAQG